MRILVESSTYHCQNMGDLAMMLVAVNRIYRHCPGASIRMLTLAPESLNRFFSAVVPVPAEARSQWANSHSLLGGYARRLPDSLANRLRSLEDGLWAAFPNAFGCAIRLERTLTARPRIDPSRFMSEIRNSDLVLVPGMGALNDAFRDHAFTLLDVLAVALRRRIPIALFGQGIGPITDSQLLHRAKEVLTQARFIGLREGLTALPWLRSLGVSQSRMEVTGDDSLELAYSSRPDALGSGIGVNIRFASYSGFDQKFLDPVRNVLDRVAVDLGAGLVPLPTSFLEEESDIAALTQLATGMSARWLGGLQPNDPRPVIEATSHCRVVVTSSYHPAVFALAQGIPAVCMEHSAYYSQKFSGLQSQFGAGCEIVPIGRPDFASRLERAIRASWASAQNRRASLLDTTSALVARGCSAYARLFAELGVVPKNTVTEMAATEAR
ncbi:MAG TPA: polysaccharide pyruvyl transferase family protein [Bryobacteraceae bacterium]|nr:polysaccharide pyruvyl transferase family protein [Bryobacteraceae bacterium]